MLLNAALILLTPVSPLKHVLVYITERMHCNIAAGCIALHTSKVYRVSQ